MIFFILSFTVAFTFVQDAIPLKPNEEFEVKLDYQFKARPASDPNTVRLGSHPDYSKSTGVGVLPYLILHIKMLSVPGEKARVAITNNRNERAQYKRVSRNDVLELDLGFTDDMIDRVQPHQYTLTLTDSEKVPVNRIVISVEEDGSFFVNGEKRGKF